MNRFSSIVIGDPRRYRWLPLLIIVMTLLAIVAGAASLRFVERRLVGATGEELTLAAAEVAEKLDRMLFERQGDAQMMSRAFSLRASDPRYLSDYLKWMKEEYAPVYLWLGVTDTQGVMVAATEPSLVGLDYRQASWFREARSTGQIDLADVDVHEANNGIETIAFSAPILDSAGTFLGVVTTRVAIPTLEEVTTRTIRSLEDRQGGGGAVEYQMLTRQGAVFVDSDLAHKGLVNLKERNLPSVIRSESGVPGFIEEEHVRRQVPVVTGYAQTRGHANFPGLRWSVLVRMDRSDILAPIRTFLWKLGILGGAVWAPMLLLLFWSTTRLRTEHQQARQESAWAKAAEAALLQSQERNRAVVETALDAVITIDSRGIVTEWNGQADKMFGWSKSEAMGRRLAELIIPAHGRDAHERELRHFLDTGESEILDRRVEMSAAHRDGHEFPVELSMSPARIGEVYYFSAFIRDITERKEADSKLRESEARYRAVVNALDEGVILIDAQGVVRTGNDSAERILGLSIKELVGRSLNDTRWQIIYEDGAPFATEDYPAAVTLRTGDPCSGVVMGVYMPDGKRRWIDVNSRAIKGADEQVAAVVVSFTDITVRKRTDNRLAAQYAVSRVLSESPSLEVAIPKILETIGANLEWDFGVFWRLDRAQGLLRCLDQWHPPSLKAEPFVVETWQHMFKPEEGLPGRIWASGEPAWVMDVAEDSNFARGPQAREVGFHGAFGFPVRVGNEVEGVVELFSRQVREPDADLLKMVEDIGLKIGQFGERARAEEALRQTEAQLRQSQKMEAVGRLAGGVAHDFNNLLTVIRGYSELLLTRLSAIDPMRKDMEEIKKAADRASGLTRQLLAFSRRQFIAAKVIDLNALIANMDGMLRPLLGGDVVELCAELDPQVGAIKADPGQVEQVIMNLAVNSRDAMPSGGRLTIETRNITIGKNSRPAALDMEPGLYVLLAIRDTGHGMTDETKSHVFEPFFTTKEKGKGTGLGLSTVYGIVKQSGGHIAVESQPGRGTTFRIYFPRVDQAARVQSGSVRLPIPPGGEKRFCWWKTSRRSVGWCRRR